MNIHLEVGRGGEEEDRRSGKELSRKEYTTAVLPCSPLWQELGGVHQPPATWSCVGRKALEEIVFWTQNMKISGNILFCRRVEQTYARTHGERSLWVLSFWILSLWTAVAGAGLHSRITLNRGTLAGTLGGGREISPP